MDKYICNFLLILSAVCLFSCGLTTSNPQTIFAKIGLNSNKISKDFKHNFDEIRLHKASGRLLVVTEGGGTKNATAVEYVNQRYRKLLDADIEDIKVLISDEASRPIIEAGLELFQYADEVYENDFPRIALMIDENRPGEEIDTAIEALDNRKGKELSNKFHNLMYLLLPYADKHRVQYQNFKIN